jgi:hypothetical protein
MKKKILIGSIIALCILIGISFTSVVGYRSIASDVKESPLFTIRSSRAIDGESEDLSGKFVGKGEDINLLIPNRYDEKEKIRKIIEIIQKMDDEYFNKLMDLNDNKLTTLVYRLMDDSNIIIRNSNNKDITTIPDWRSCWETFYTVCPILDIIAFLIAVLIKVILQVHTIFGILWTCNQDECPGPS